MAERDQLGGKKIKRLPGIIATLSNDAEFFPGLSFRQVDRAIVEAVRSTADYLDAWAATSAA